MSISRFADTYPKECLAMDEADRITTEDRADGAEGFMIRKTLEVPASYSKFIVNEVVAKDPSTSGKLKATDRIHGVHGREDHSLHTGLRFDHVATVFVQIVLSHHLHLRITIHPGVEQWSTQFNEFLRRRKDRT